MQSRDVPRCNDLLESQQIGSILITAPLKVKMLKLFHLPFCRLPKSICYVLFTSYFTQID